MFVEIFIGFLGMLIPTSLNFYKPRYTYRMRPFLLSFGFLLILPFTMSASTMTVTPQTPLQGEAVLVHIDVSTSSVQSLKRNGTTVPTFGYQSGTGALIGIDLNAAIGTSTLQATLTNGEHINTSFVVLARAQAKEAFTVPAKLGGNSSSSQKKVVSALESENSVLAALISNNEITWSQPFIAPVANPIITDPYGYIRDSGSATITHKGADFHADTGTPVIAMNRGVVRLSKKFTIYGNTLIIDHGNGLMTFYMHLSQRTVTQGTLVEQGQIIGYSGSTGYAEHPHLHLSVHINGTSIDPVEFLKLFGVSL
jgi:murein DD-endopeptidase MepM/ murein hydrolase activator NlpD